MKWEGQRESENVEDRRGISGGHVAAGGGIGLVVMVVLALDAARRAIDALMAEGRQRGDLTPYWPTIEGLKLMSDDLLGDEPSMDSLDRLLAWLTEHGAELSC